MDGVRYVIDDDLGLWVKFQVKTVSEDKRKQGIRYALSLHDRQNTRIMGFDNAHLIRQGNIYDHWHADENDTGRPYHYQNAEKLLKDFWCAVDKKLKNRLENPE